LIGKNGHLESKLIEVQQQSSELAETVVQYVKGILENCFFFLIFRISGFLTICYFSKPFLILMILKMQKTFFMKYIILLHYHYPIKKKRVVDLQNISESFNVEILNNLKLYQEHS
jgi:hypothetical protein